MLAILKIVSSNGYLLGMDRLLEDLEIVLKKAGLCL
jgi:hypothetical protein